MYLDNTDAEDPVVRPADHTIVTKNGATDPKWHEGVIGVIDALEQPLVNVEQTCLHSSGSDCFNLTATHLHQVNADQVSLALGRVELVERLGLGLEQGGGKDLALLALVVAEVFVGGGVVCHGLIP